MLFNGSLLVFNPKITTDDRECHRASSTRNRRPAAVGSKQALTGYLPPVCLKKVN